MKTNCSCKKKNQDVQGSGAREEQAHRKRALVHHEAAVEVKGAQPGSLKQHKKPKHRRRLQRRFRQRLFMGTGGSSVRCGLASAGDDGGKKASAASKAAAGATALSARVVVAAGDAGTAAGCAGCRSAARATTAKTTPTQMMAGGGTGSSAQAASDSSAAAVTPAAIAAGVARSATAGAGGSEFLAHARQRQRRALSRGQGRPWWLQSSRRSEQMQRLTRILVIGKRMAMFRWGPRRQCCSWPAGWAAGGGRG